MKCVEQWDSAHFVYLIIFDIQTREVASTWDICFPWGMGVGLEQEWSSQETIQNVCIASAYVPQQVVWASPWLAH